MLKHMAKIRRVVLYYRKGSGMDWIIASKLKSKYLKSYICCRFYTSLRTTKWNQQKFFC